MGGHPDQPRRQPPPVPPPPPAEDYHCANCLFLGDPAKPEEGFWACQNLCIRE